MKAHGLEGHYAGFLSRAVSLVLDFWIVSAILALVGVVTSWLLSLIGLNPAACGSFASLTPIGKIACASGGGIAIVAFFATSPLYYTLCWALVGQTVGQRVLGLRVLRLDGRDLGLRRSFVRYLGYGLCLLTFGLGFLWVLVDDRRMGWHDKLARSCVIYDWKAAQNEGLIARVSKRFSRKKPANLPPQQTSP